VDTFEQGNQSCGFIQSGKFLDKEKEDIFRFS